MGGLIYRINVKPQITGQRGLPKKSVESVFVAYNGLEGDFNRYRNEKKNGNPDMAVLLFPLETIGTLRKEGWPVEPGHLGENMTTMGIPYERFSSGNIYSVGDAAQIQISEPCNPCRNLELLPYVGEERKAEFIKTLVGRRGWYARVLKEGMIIKGDQVLET